MLVQDSICMSLDRYILNADNGTAPGPAHVLTLLEWWLGNRVQRGSAELLRRWYSPQCQTMFECHHAGPSADPRGKGGVTWGGHVPWWGGREAPAGTRWGPRHLETVCTREDAHAGGRVQSSGDFGHGVYVNHQYRLAYVCMQKAASNSVMAALSEALGKSWDREWYRDLTYTAAAPQDCVIERPLSRDGAAKGSYTNRLRHQRADHAGAGDDHVGAETDPVGAGWSYFAASSSCLTREMLSGYFFFTFVRDPAARFRSALAEALKRRKNSAEHSAMGGGVAWMLRDMLEGRVLDSHLETQASTLGSHVPLSDPDIVVGVPWDFIGRVEHLAADFQELTEALRRHNVRNVLPLPPLDIDAVARRNEGGAWKRRVEEEVLGVEDSVALQALVREVYAQDFQCLGSEQEA